MKRIPALLLVICLFSADLSADNVYRKFDRFVRKIMMSGLDTTYITMASTSWEIPVNLGVHGRAYRITTAEGIRERDNSGNIGQYGVGIGYHGLDFIWTNDFGRNNRGSDYFEFNFYDNYLGFQMMNSTREDNGVGYYSATYGCYFAFNGKRYSYPASIYGNYIQKKSAGSPMIFFWYDKNKSWNMNGPNGDESYELHTFSLCGGYGYNFVLNGGRTLFNITAAAGLMAPYWGISAQTRFSFIHWFTENIRINASAVQYSSAGWKSGAAELLSSEWMASIGLGICFGK
ncbi:MAG: DUF4421 domain-containing protein [Bacteroidales bacterium]|nr:DUF4421 domain-containing protein [Bacteroidales bacterium]